MKLRDKFSSESLRNVFLRLGVWIAFGLCLIMLGVLWFSGFNDTGEAMRDGRRLLITLETGAIEGKQVALDAPEATPAAKDAPPTATNEAGATPAASNEASTPAAAESTATPPAQSESPAASPQESPSADLDNPAAQALNEAIATSPAEISPVKPATVPLAEIKSSLLEKTASGNVPAISSKGVKPWHYYSKPYSHKGHLPTIAIIVTGLGQNRTVTDAALRLPENMTLSFSPYARDLEAWVHAARRAGHEIMLDLPLEPTNFPASDPGPYGLIVGKGKDENAKRLVWLMSRTEGYIGFLTPLNESYSSDDESFKELLDQLTKRGLMIGLSHEPARTETRRLLDTEKIPYSTADVIIDEELSPGGIRARLQALEKTASKRGFAIGLAQAYPLTMQQLAQWSADLEKTGYSLVPLTFITHIRFQGS